MKSSLGLSNLLNFDTLDFRELSRDQYKSEVVNKWSDTPCGSNYSKETNSTGQYFEDIEKHRYSSHPWILEAIQNFDIKNKRVLEVGFGMGTDHLVMARMGAIMHGIDLTPKNFDIARKRFHLFGAHSALIPGDCENLPFAEGSMDFVYSLGVIHHAPDTQRAISEIYRVLKPNGKCYIAVYNKRSLFFWWSIFMGNCLIKKGWEHRTLHQQLSLIEYPQTNPNLFVKLYSRDEFIQLFKNFKSVKTQIKHLIPADIFYFGSFFKKPFSPTPFLSRLGKRIGWYIIIEATK